MLCYNSARLPAYPVDSIGLYASLGTPCLGRAFTVEERLIERKRKVEERKRKIDRKIEERLKKEKEFRTEDRKVEGEEMNFILFF